MFLAILYYFLLMILQSSFLNSGLELSNFRTSILLTDFGLLRDHHQTQHGIEERLILFWGSAPGRHFQHARANASGICQVLSTGPISVGQVLLHPKALNRGHTLGIQKYGSCRARSATRCFGKFHLRRITFNINVQIVHAIRSRKQRKWPEHCSNAFRQITLGVE